MDLLLSRLNRYMYICVMYVYVYVMELHVCIGYDKCMLCLLVCKCSRLILHHVGCSGFHKLGSGCFKTC